ncbi:MAG: hypothetical protein AAB787_02050 [Patescibacteria group bacterium]
MSGVSQNLLLISVPILATLEIYYSFWFWGWLVDCAGDLRKIQETRRELGREGLLDRWVVDSILSVYHNVIDPQNTTRRRIHKYGIWAVWIAGLNPIPGLPTRGPCAAFLGVFRSKHKFNHLVLANLIHTIFIVWGWSHFLER